MDIDHDRTAHLDHGLECRAETVTVRLTPPSSAKRGEVRGMRGTGRDVFEGRGLLAIRTEIRFLSQAMVMLEHDPRKIQTDVRKICHARTVDWTATTDCGRLPS